MSGGTFFGNATPGDFANIYSALDFMISQRLARISTATYCEVVRGAYGADENDIEPGTVGPIGFVDVQPLVNQLDPSDQATPHAPVYGVCYYRNQTANGAFINDPAIGDIGKLVASDRDVSVVKATGAQASPGSRRKFAKEDGTFFPCVIAGAPTQWFAWLDKGFNITDAFGNTIIGTENGVLINGTLVKLNGDIITKHGVDVDMHTHNQPNDSAGDSEMPTLAPNT
jgi:hypothetical protein